MLESEDEIRELQALIDRTFAQANPHLAAIVKPERRLTARQVVRYLQGTKVALGTVNERGEPRVAPLDRRLHPGAIHRLHRWPSGAPTASARQPPRAAPPIGTAT